MNQPPQTPPDDTNDEIAVLVGRLRETEQRLRELTGGAESALDPGGQSSLFRDAQEKLRLSEERFREMFVAAATGMAISTPRGRFLQVNPAYCRMLGYTQEELLALDFMSLTHPDDLPLNLELVEEVLSGRRDSFIMEKRYLKKNGNIHWIRASVAAARTSTQEIASLIVIAEDIAERKLAELRLLRLNRLHTVLSKVGETIARTRDRQNLFDAVCRIVVEYGLLRMVFIAEVDAEGGVARPVASYGEGLDTPLWESKPAIPTHGLPSGLCTVATAVSSGAYDVCNRIATAERMSPWREIASKSGFLAGASFPFTLKGEIVGVLTLFAGETDYFQDDEIDLMAAVANNLSFALESIEESLHRKRTEEALQRQQIELLTLFDLMPALIWFKDTENRILRINQRAALATGKSVAEIEGRSMLEIYPLEAAKYHADDLEVIRSGAPKLAIIEKLRDSEGNELWVQTDKVPYGDRDGNVIGIVVMSQDISDRRRMEARLRRLVESNAQSVFFWKTNGQVTGSNDAFLRLVGYTREDLEAGKINWMALTPPEYAENDRRAFKEVADFGSCTTYEKEYIRKDGSRAPILVGAAVFEDDPTEGVCFVVDLSERKKLEQQFRQSQKMEAIGQLTGGIAHDFNNLLGIIQLNLELIRELMSQDPGADMMVDMALEATKRGASLTHQLLAYARQQPLEPKPVDVETLLDGMAALFGRTLGESIEIKTVIPQDLWMAVVDAHQLENALLNLAVNSLHAMPNGGKLIIEAANTVLDEIYVGLNPDASPGQYVRISVTDSGAGMAADVLERVMEPFFTTKPVGKGSGLGLSMVHGFAKQSGGHLKIYSEVGFGTAVNLYLPRASTAGKPKPEARQERALPSMGGEVVLVVEDDRNLRSLTLLVLKSLGYRTVEAEDGPAACEILDGTDRIDLLLTDVVLPKGMNGPELAKHAKSRRPGLRVLFVSGYPRDAILRDGMLDDDMYLLSKPFPKVELARMVRRVLDERPRT